jgi:hypothetical protein
VGFSYALGRGWLWLITEDKGDVGKSINDVVSHSLIFMRYGPAPELQLPGCLVGGASDILTKNMSAL